MNLNKFFAVAASAALSTLAAAHAAPMSLEQAAHMESMAAVGPSVDAGNSAELIQFGINASRVEFYNMTINGQSLSDYSLVDDGELILGTNRKLTVLVLDLSKYWGTSVSNTIRAIRASVADSTANKAEHSIFASLSNGETLTNPIPAAFILFLFGGAGLLGASRKKLMKAGNA